MASPRTSGRTTHPSKRKAEQEKIEAEVSGKKRRTSPNKTSPEDNVASSPENDVASSDTEAPSPVNTDSTATVDDRSSTEPSSRSTEPGSPAQRGEGYFRCTECKGESSLAFSEYHAGVDKHDGSLPMPGLFHHRNTYAYVTAKPKTDFDATLSGFKYDLADAELRLLESQRRGECLGILQQRYASWREQEEMLESAFGLVAADMEHANQTLALDWLTKMEHGEIPLLRGLQVDDDPEVERYKQTLIQESERRTQEPLEEEVTNPKGRDSWEEDATKEASRQAEKKLGENATEEAIDKDIETIMAKHDFLKKFVSPEKRYMRTYQRVGEKHEIEDDIKNILSEAACAEIRAKKMVKKTDREFRKHEQKPYSDERDQPSYWHDKKWGIAVENKAYLRKLESLARDYGEKPWPL